MYFKTILYILLIFLLCGLSIWLYSIYKKFLHKYIKKYLFKVEDDEDLPEDVKYKRYIEKKQKEIVKQSLERPLNNDVVEYESRAKIVAIIEPIGRWTRMVMTEKMQRMSGMKLNEKHNGFWQMIVSMKGLAQGKHRGRGR